jgi:hypothetical protein
MAKVVKGVDSFTVYKLDNGFTIEYSGNDSNDSWANAKLIVANEKDLIDIIKEVNAIPKSN